MKISPLCSLRERSATLCNCFTAEQVDLIQLLLCSGECNTEDLYKTNVIFFHLKGWFPLLGLGGEVDWALTSAWAVLQPDFHPRCEGGQDPAQVQAVQALKVRTVSKAETGTNSKNKLLVSSGWLPNASQNTCVYQANSNKRQKGLQMKWVSNNLIF